MKSKFVKLLTVSLATSILLAPTQRAFGLGAEPQTLLKETPPKVETLLSSQAANSQKTQSQGLVQEKQVVKSQPSETAHPTAAASPANQSSQTPSVGQIDQVLGLCFVSLVFMYILVGLQYKKYRTHRAAVLLQQIETLERIWNMKPHR